MSDTPPPLAAFAARLKQARQAAGMSQRALAKACGLHQPQVARTESGQDAQLSTVLALAAALDCDLTLTPRTPGPAGLAVPAGPTLLAQDAAPAQDRIDSNLAAYQHAWPSINPLTFALIARIQRAAQFLDRATEQVAAKHGINGGELMLLGALRRVGPPFESTATRLRQLFFISMPGMSKRLDRLSARGLIERQPSDQDRRVVLIRLLPAGHAVLDSAVGQDQAEEFIILDQLPPSEAHPLSLLLRGLLRRFETRHARSHRKTA